MVLVCKISTFGVSPRGGNALLPQGVQNFIISLPTSQNSTYETPTILKSLS